MKSARQLVDEALAQVQTIDVAALRDRLLALGRPAQNRVSRDMRLLDIREADEVAAEGSIAGAVHVPRGLLEFRLDPASPWFDASLTTGVQEWVLYCGVGWRSALAAKALQEMGLQGVSHLGGGFQAWLAAGGAVQRVAPAAAERIPDAERAAPAPGTEGGAGVG